MFTFFLPLLRSSGGVAKISHKHTSHHLRTLFISRNLFSWGGYEDTLNPIFRPINHLLRCHRESSRLDRRWIASLGWLTCEASSRSGFYDNFNELYKYFRTPEALQYSLACVALEQIFDKNKLNLNMIISFPSWRGGAGDDNRMTMRQSVILGVLSKYCGLKRLIPP